MAAAERRDDLGVEDGDDDDIDEHELRRQEEAYQKQYENEQTWDQLQEDEFGNLFVDKTAEQRARRKRLLSAAQSARIRKGMIRYLLLVVDLSRAASATDLRPNRLACMLGLARSFVREFFDQNPLSQLGIAVMRGGLVDRLTDLSGSPEAQVARLEAGKLGAAAGDASLQNALDLSVSLLRSLPPYGHREVLMLFAALSSCDPGNILDSVRACKENHIRVSVVGVAAEVYVCRRIADDTGGSYGVALHEAHLEQLLMAHAHPPPASQAQARAELVRMGFPQRSTEDASSAVFVGLEARLLPGSYTCPACKARVPELPCECHICGLTLISSPHLARSYHHLFPVPPYHEDSQVNAGAQPLGTLARIGSSDGFGCTTSAEFLNRLGGCDDNTPKFLSPTVDGRPERCPSFPDSYPCVPGPRLGSPEAEAPQAVGEEEQAVLATKKGSKAKASKRAVAAPRGGRKGGVTKGRAVRKAPCPVGGPPAPASFNSIFRGTIGGTGTLQASPQLPWTLSLVQLNRFLMPEMAVPETDP
ncbi:hypothetical protein GPECTOR_1g748 [Gonium pectorale]|uniref:VWFA domain-containing protein n=1 Tax=Gonium pectorale TaxID=33097 RepID=A0A150H3V9_GONPE|nr:hypothetical protein GPECTOR_1g748 [Gonium pectorale]|eukprot:KXZ56829.1 hypothetical protein GPECTOR_1g748 [Gonium pectorale]